MHPQDPSRVEDVRPPDDQSAHGSQPATTAPRPRRRRLPLVAAILVPVLVAGAIAITYALGGFNDHGRFGAEPPACATLEPSVHLLGISYTLQEDKSNNCDLLLPPDHPDYLPSPEITVAYYVATPRRADAPAAASQLLRRLGPDFQPLSGVGDEAFVRNRDVFLRVSNLVVAIVVFPREFSTEAQVRAFASDVAVRLRDG